MPLKPTSQIGKPTKTEDWLDARKGKTMVTPKNRKYSIDWERVGNKYFVILIYKNQRMKVKLSDYNKTNTDDLLTAMERGMQIENSNNMTKSKLSERRIPKKGTADYHQHKIAVDTIKTPMKGVFLGGPTAKEAEQILKTKFGYVQSDIDRLKEMKVIKSQINQLIREELQFDQLNENSIKIGNYISADLKRFLVDVVIPKSRGYVKDERDAALLLYDILKFRYNI